MTAWDALFAVPAQRSRRRPGADAIGRLHRQIDDLEQQLAEAEEDLLTLQEDIEASWPSAAELLAVYGAPGNWPVEAAA